MAALLIRRSFMYGTPRAYKKAANDQEGERRGTSAAATVIEKIFLHADNVAHHAHHTGSILKIKNNSL